MILRTTCHTGLLAAALLLTAHSALADEQLIGTWVGTGQANQGTRVTVERDAVTIEGQRLPLRVVSPGVMEIGPPGERYQLRYEVQGDTLTTVDEDGRATWRREQARAQPQPPTPQPKPLAGGATAGDPFARRFVGDGLTLTLSGSAAGGYRGELTLSGTTYPVAATSSGAALSGTFTSGEHSYAFEAKLAGDALTLVSGGKQYRLQGAALKAPVAGGNASGAVIMVEHRLRDKGSRNMESHTLLAPKGWTVTGGAWWTSPKYFNVLPSRDIKITAPDGREVRLAPSIIARDMIPPPDLNMARPQELSADKGIPVLYLPESLEAWKRWIEQRAIREGYKGATNVRVTNAVVVPELTAVLNKQIEWRRQMLAQQAQQDANMGLRTFIDAKVLAFECSYTHQGRAWEELVIFGVSWEGIEGQLIGRSTTWSINPSVSYRAPAGKLDASMPLLVSILNTARETPQWSKMRAELQAKLAGIAAEGARKANAAAMERSRMLAKSSNEINDIIMGGYKKRQAIRDSTHRKVINSLRGTEDYVVPGGNTTVNLPSDYQKVYSNGNGEYLLTNDVLYDPNTDSNLNSSQWTGMEARRR